MAEPHLDHPGDWHWFTGHGPAAALGPCPHRECQHQGQSVIAWGPSADRYELVVCDSHGGCAGECRAWVDMSGRVATPWTQVGQERIVRASCRHCRRPITLVSAVGWLHDEPTPCDSAQPAAAHEKTSRHA